MKSHYNNKLAELKRKSDANRFTGTHHDNAIFNFTNCKIPVDLCRFLQKHSATDNVFTNKVDEIKIMSEIDNIGDDLEVSLIDEGYEIQECQKIFHQLRGKTHNYIEKAKT